jgi:tetratricopeptide (TPR) repeat protein
LLSGEGEIQHALGNLDVAVRLIREAYDGLTATGDRSFASTIAVALGSALLDLHQDDDAWKYGTIARETSSSDDVISQAGGRAVQAGVLSRRGDHQAAEALAREAVEIMERTDYLVQHGEVLVHLAHVLHAAGKAEEAATAAREGLQLFERKGATFYAEQTQRLIDEWSV